MSENNEDIDFLVSLMLEERKTSNEIIENFEKELMKLPNGGLYHKVINGKPYLYHYSSLECGSKSKKQKCITSNDEKLAASLKRRHFIETSLTCLRTNTRIIDAFIEKYTPYDEKSIVKKMKKAYQDLPEKVEQATNSTWLDDAYEKSSAYQEGLIHVTAGGLKVRSKSEAIIAGLLRSNNIKFHYEEALHIGKRTYYPDFTVFKPKSGKVLYWEHFGLINDDEYNLGMEQKLSAFKRHGIVPWENLITTYDSDNGSINVETIQNIINAFLL